MVIIHRLGAKNDEGKLDRKATKTSRPEPDHVRLVAERSCVTSSALENGGWSPGPWHICGATNNPYPAIAPPRRDDKSQNNHGDVQVDEEEMSFSSTKQNPPTFISFQVWFSKKNYHSERNPPPAGQNLSV